jgi:hypothetical protein
MTHLTRTRKEAAAARRVAIRRYARRMGADQPLRTDELVYEIWAACGIHTTASTVRKDMRAIIDRDPHLYYLRSGALYRGA